MNLRRSSTSLPRSRMGHAARPLKCECWTRHANVSKTYAAFVFSIVLALALCTTSSAATVDYRAYRAALVDLMGVVGDVHARAGANAPGSRTQIELAAQLFGTLNNRQIDALAVSLPEARLRAVVNEARRQLDTSPLSREKSVVVAQPDVTPAFCSDYPAPVVLAALTTKHVAQHVIDALEFTCQESVPPGINNALVCEGPEIASAAADIASDLADFCGNQGSAATNDAVLYTERSIGTHLNTQMDTVLSTRATQTSVDAANAAATSNNALAGDIQSQLDQDVDGIELQIVDALDQLSDLAGAVSDIQSRTDEISFRVQISQANVEDAQDRSADLQAKAAELITSLTFSRTVANAAASNAITLTPGIQATAKQQRRDDLGAALGDADAQISSFALPFASGGRIEEAREVLIAAIVALQALGQGNTAQASTLLAAGDQDYNAGRYADAWRKFSEAYRLLDPHTIADAGAAR
jgi:hypothetical protein